VNDERAVCSDDYQHRQLSSLAGFLAGHLRWAATREFWICLFASARPGRTLEAMGCAAGSGQAGLQSSCSDGRRKSGSKALGHRDGRKSKIVVIKHVKAIIIARSGCETNPPVSGIPPPKFRPLAGKGDSTPAQLALALARCRV